MWIVGYIAKIISLISYYKVVLRRIITMAIQQLDNQCFLRNNSSSLTVRILGIIASDGSSTAAWQAKPERNAGYGGANCGGRGE